MDNLFCKRDLKLREQRWETQASLSFGEILSLGKRLSSMGLKPAKESTEIICYIEEWKVDGEEEIAKLEPWFIEDVTLVHIRDGWEGDFYLLSGEYHSHYQKFQGVGTYCSISHPWKIKNALLTHLPESMFWVGFRHIHGFIRVRLHTREVITPWEKQDEDNKNIWKEERRRAFLEAVQILELPVEVTLENEKLILRSSNPGAALFCSWPDAFGPCQFEYNVSNPFEMIVPASCLAEGYGGGPRTIRSYLTGFSQAALKIFGKIQSSPQLAYRCSAHSELKGLPKILNTVGKKSRLYMTLCEFQTQEVFPNLEDIYAIVGIVCVEGEYKIEVRLNKVSLPKDEMGDWIEKFLMHEVVYAPLPPFP